VARVLNIADIFRRRRRWGKRKRRRRCGVSALRLW
jgi:hypothetical protein